MPKKGPPEESAPNVEVFGKKGRDSIIPPRFQTIETKGQPEKSAPQEAGEDTETRPESQSPGPAEDKQTTQEKVYAGKYENVDELEKGYLHSTTENLKLAQKVADLERQLNQFPKEPSAQEKLKELLDKDPNFFEDPLNTARYTQQQIDQRLNQIIPELEFKRHFEGQAKQVFGDKVDFSEYDKPVRLPNGENASMYGLVRNYMLLLGRGRENPYLALYAIDNASNLTDLLNKSKEQGAKAAVKQVVQKASQRQERPGPNPAGMRKPSTVGSELFKGAIQTGNWGPFLKEMLKQDGHSIFQSNKEE